MNHSEVIELEETGLCVCGHAKSDHTFTIYNNNGKPEHIRGACKFEGDYQKGHLKCLCKTYRDMGGMWSEE